MRRLRTFAVVLLAAFATMPAAVAGAQDADKPVELRIDSADVSDYPAVRLSVSVPATTEGALPPEAFAVREDGETQLPTVEYTASDDLQILLLMDTTGSMSGAPLAGAQQAAVNFIGNLPGETDVAVMAYDAQPRLLSDFTASDDDHLAAIEALGAAGRTAMYDAVLAATKVFPDTDNATSRVIVLLADGEDNQSVSGVEAATDALTDADITLHSVEYLTAFTDEAAIRQMTDATEGSVLEAADADELRAVYEQLAADLISRYSLDYTSDGRGSVEVAVDVEHDGFAATGSRTIQLPDQAEPPPVDQAPVEQEGAAAPPSADPPASIEVEVSGLARAALIVGAVLWFLALLIFVLVWTWPRERRPQLWGMATSAAGKQGSLSELANRASRAADRTLQRRGYDSKLNRALERAGVGLRPGEFVVLMFSAAVTAFGLGYVLSGWFPGFAFASAALIGFRLALSFLGDRRQARFADQLGETLQLLSGSLRAGYSFMQAIDAVAREADSPSAEEFSRLVIETRLGRDTGEALEVMAERMQSEDFLWVVQAIEIHREVGGDLAEVLDTVAETIRERNQIRRQVKALSAEGRMSAYILLALPFGVGFLIYLSNPSYIGELTQGGLLGWALIGIGVISMTIGVIWMRKLVKLVF